MRALLDTSAAFAYLDADAQDHARIVDEVERLADERALVTHSYVVVETMALVQHRLGLQAVQDFVMGVEAACDVVWVDAALHRRAAAALLTSDRRSISLVDHVSFLVMWEHGIEVAVALDTDFEDQGFTILPS